MFIFASCAPMIAQLQPAAIVLDLVGDENKWRSKTGVGAAASYGI
jgi:hypothetical protein